MADIIDQIKDLVQKGQCILMLGAGVHAPPASRHNFTYPDQQRPPLGNALANIIMGNSNFAANFPGEDFQHSSLGRISLAYEIETDRNTLVKIIKREVDQQKQPSAVLRALAELNFPLVITTNYDHLFERALQKANKEPIVSIYEPDRNLMARDYEEPVLDPNRPFLFKIHGDIDFPDSIVITDEDYISFMLRLGDADSVIPEVVRYHLKLLPILFLGYSLIDYNLRLLFKGMCWAGKKPINKRSLSVDYRPDCLIQRLYSSPLGPVSFICQDVWDFVPDLYTRINNKPMPQ